MQMVSFVLESEQILPKGGMRSDKKLLISEKLRPFNSNLISGQRGVRDNFKLSNYVADTF